MVSLVSVQLWRMSWRRFSAHYRLTHTNTPVFTMFAGTDSLNNAELVEVSGCLRVAFSAFVQGSVFLLFFVSLLLCSFLVLMILVFLIILCHVKIKETQPSMKKTNKQTAKQKKPCLQRNRPVAKTLRKSRGSVTHM